MCNLLCISSNIVPWGLDCCYANDSRYSSTAVPLPSHSINGQLKKRISPWTYSISTTSLVLITVHRGYMMPWLMLSSMLASMRGIFLRLVKVFHGFCFVRCVFFYPILSNVACKMTLIFQNNLLRKP
jgi:hypothetical protein